MKYKVEDIITGEITEYDFIHQINDDGSVTIAPAPGEGKRIILPKGFNPISHFLPPAPLTYSEEQL